ncbi:MAG: xanthine dehydrogenase accessory protein XdhC [Pseudomonadota bacterium]
MADLHALTRFCLSAVERGEPAALITQCAVEGSTPRERGVRMAVTPTSVHGTIGGGNLEQLAIDQARRLLGDPERHFLLQDHPLGPLLAQCCGGHVRLLIERLEPIDKDWLLACDEAAERGAPVTLRTTLTGTGPRKAVVAGETACGFTFFDQHGDRLTALRPPLTECAEMLERFGRPRPQLWLYGAGHVGRATAEIMKRTIFDVSCFDGRESERSQLPPDVTASDLSDVERVINSAPAQSHHVVFTHSHDLDYTIVHGILARGDFAYLGLIGSQTKRSRFFSRLRAAGFDETVLARLNCPIGTPGIESKAPEAVAIAVAHELMASLGPDDDPTRAIGL